MSSIEKNIYTFTKLKDNEWSAFTSFEVFFEECDPFLEFDSISSAKDQRTAAIIQKLSSQKFC